MEESTFEEFENIEQEKTYSDLEIFTKIFTEPRAVFNFIIRTEYRKYYYLLFMVYGIIRAMDKFAQKHNDWDFLVTIILAIVSGGVIGWISLYFYSFLVSWVGDYMKGEGTFEDVLTVFTYANIPNIITLLFVFIAIIIGGKAGFYENFDDSSLSETTQALLYICMAIQVFFSFWSLALMIIGLSFVQKFSIPKAILNFSIPALLFVLLLFIFIFFSKH